MKLFKEKFLKLRGFLKYFFRIEDLELVNIKIYACCNPNLLEIPQIFQAQCIDGKYLSKLWKIKLSQDKDSVQREACGCKKPGY
jgi:hypothetical protein